MEKIIQKSNFLISQVETSFKRNLHQKIDWNDRLIGIKGARGTGKTTLILQRLKSLEINTGIYITLDDIYFNTNSLVDFIEEYRSAGGTHIFIDEIHKYPNWAQSLKNIHDTYRELHIVFTGSSILDIYLQEVDLSRRVAMFELAGLSFREYLYFQNKIELPVLELEELLQTHEKTAIDISQNFKPLPAFKEYLTQGYYPFFEENPNTYQFRLEQVVRLILENDMRFIEGFDPHNTRKLFQLLAILANNVPMKPNVSKLSEKIGLSRNTLSLYFHYLEKARLINMVYSAGKSISTLQKPDKILLENPNLSYALSLKEPDPGSVREAFFVNQLSNAGEKVEIPLKGDFKVREKFVFEVGGKNKDASQVRGVENSYLAVDNIEFGALKKIPLWLFGLLY